ncbi:serine proteinase inhibitor IA-1 [Lactarius pseudohatsudake]|nr:serine proteinase inhibitor IA-1 [Lactarius pseudohatsudake]
MSESEIGKFIVVFKKSASDEAINDQAEKVGLNGGTVERKFSSTLLRGFSAKITNTYLMTLQQGLTQADSQIDYIEPDSTVTTQMT